MKRSLDWHVKPQMKLLTEHYHHNNKKAMGQLKNKCMCSLYCSLKQAQKAPQPTTEFWE